MNMKNFSVPRSRKRGSSEGSAQFGSSQKSRPAQHQLGQRGRQISPIVKRFLVITKMSIDNHSSSFAGKLKTESLDSNSSAAIDLCMFHGFF